MAWFNKRCEMDGERPVKTCLFCGGGFGRRMEPRGKYEAIADWKTRKYCSRKCRDAVRLNQPVKDNPTEAALHYRASKLIPPGPCQQCGSPDAHDVHHKDQNPANNSLDNLIRLCHPCHAKAHVAEQRRCLVCDKPHHGHGYCDTHRRNFTRYGSPFPPERKRGKCVLCGKPVHGRGLCGTHYHQWFLQQRRQPHGLVC